jgi:hypothetical protein
MRSETDRSGFRRAGAPFREVPRHYAVAAAIEAASESGGGAQYGVREIAPAKASERR